MPFPKALADAQRQAMQETILGALDRTEEVYRGLGEMQAHNVGMKPDTYRDLRVEMERAYNALCKARQLADEE